MKRIVIQSIRESLVPSVKDIELERLAGDASNRSYYRVRLRDAVAGCGQNSIILMKLNQPDPQIVSEEISTISQTFDELPFINILRHLHLCGLNVPRLYHYDEGRGLLFLEDLGETLLEEKVKGKERKIQRKYYRKAVDELIKLQFRGTERKDAHCFAFRQAFNTQLFMWEFEHFLEYGIEKLHGIEVPNRDRKIIQRSFKQISERLSSQPRYFTHRDYHSRNLIVQNEQIKILDFQDALLGPCQYDLASLLRDSYLTLEESFIDEMIHYYLDGKEDIEGIRIDRTEFRELFDLTSIQRNLKAAGRFGYINLAKNNDRYLKYIAPTLGYVKKNLDKYDYLKELKQVLEKYVEEFR
ncbi:MAG: phosphotransferase [Deltaproteobacteria bacterium]|nr:MAG: phosphotransferase [Deltaproteobacteria bacterium]